MDQNELNKLTKIEVKYINLLLNEISQDKMCEELQITHEEIRLINTRLKNKWDRRLDVGIVLEAVKRGFYDLGNPNLLLLEVWVNKTTMSIGLKNELLRFVSEIDRNNFTVQDLDKKVFTSRKNCGVQKWEEFRRLINESSEEVKLKILLKR